MERIADLIVQVFELNYRQQQPNNGNSVTYGFCGGAIEPLLGGGGYLNSDQCLQALGLEDYGYVYCGDRTIAFGAIQYNGHQWSQQNGADGPATGSLSDESTSHFIWNLYNLVPNGYIKYGSTPFTPAATYQHDANKPGDNGHLDASLGIGPCPFDQDFSQIDGSQHPSDFVLPYVMYDYNQLYAGSAEVGQTFLSIGVPPEQAVTPINDMISTKVTYSIGYEGYLAGCTNELGNYTGATTYLPPVFRPWSNWKARAAVDGGDQEPGDIAWTDLPNEEPLQSAFAQGAYLQNARRFFILKGGQIFDGQPETPILFNPVAKQYQCLQLVGMTDAAKELIAAGGISLSYSALQNCFYFIGNPPDYPRYIFGSNFVYPFQEPVIETPPGLVLRIPHTSIVPRIRMPCYGVRPPQPKLRR